MPSVVIFAFDGLQPAQVNAELMPNLSALAAKGVTFANHHAVFPTVTRVNVSSIVTGKYPGGHGLAANFLVIREFDPDQAMQAMEPELDQVARKTGRVLLTPTLAEILHRNQQEFVAIGVGTSGNAYLQNPTAARTGGATIHPNFTLPYGLNEDIIGRFGPWPDEAHPNTPRMAHAMRIMTEYILPERQPAVALIWSYEPDKSQHYAGVGSGLSNTAIKEADQQLGNLVAWLEETGRAATTNVMVVSDHGYSTISEVVDVEAMVREAGFPPGDESGGVVVARNGGSVLFYVREGNRIIAERLAAWLMEQVWCGTITVSEAVSGIPGTLPASLVGNEGPRAPEITMSFRWESTANEAGYHGMSYSSGAAPGLGQHGSMSKHEMNNVLFAWGPSFKTGLKLDIPSGNVDLAPTILAILGMYGDGSMDGRILEEALAGGPRTDDIDWSTELHNAERELDDKVYRQQIKLSKVSSTIYVDEGSSTLGFR
ncbi:MAG: alkaline phosphatase family protein [Chloroflexi bacterium]|nr:alkaline phosphatase family protein [Chloroflexota bacterium]